MDTLLLTSADAAPAGLAAAHAVLGEDGAVEVAQTSSRETPDVALDGLGGRRLVLAGGDSGLHEVVKRLWRRGELCVVALGLVPVRTAGRRRGGRHSGGVGVVNAVHLDAAAAGPARSLFGRRGWRLHVNVDDEVLADGSQRVLTVAIGNGSGTGDIDVLVQGPAESGSGGTGGVPFRLVRRARGRAVSVPPDRGVEIGLIAEGERGTLRGRRSWEIEPGAWAVYR